MVLGEYGSRACASRFTSNFDGLAQSQHYDHCDLPTMRIARERSDPVVVTPLGNGRLVRSAVCGARGTGLVQEAMSSHRSITLTGASLFRSNTLDRIARSGWGSRSWQGRAHLLYRDTARSFFRASVAGGCNRVALLPIGAYEPRWFCRRAHDIRQRRFRPRRSRRETSVAMHLEHSS